jgi:hypothetical protein
MSRNYLTHSLFKRQLNVAMQKENNKYCTFTQLAYSQH